MSLLDVELRQAAYDLIQELGRVVYFEVITTPGTFDPQTGAVTGQVVATVERKSTPPGSEGFRFPIIESSRFPPLGVVPEGQTFIYIAALNLTFTPAKGQRFIANGTVYQIEEVERILSGEEICLYGILGKS